MVRADRVGTRLDSRSGRPALRAPRRRSGSDRLTEEIVELIRREGLAAGDRLPALPALAARLSVATPTVREALQRLQAIGVVDIRHGSGVYVRRPARRMLVSNPYRGELNAGLILDLLDARAVIEPQLALLAAGRCTAAAARKLAATLAQAEQALEGQDALLSDLNMDFHRSVAGLAGNAVLEQILEALLDLYANERMVILQLFDNRERDHREHVEIFDALRARDGDRAAECMRTHLEGVRAVLARRLRSSR
jgi:GntR family transcriptional repressor for pyruvate dehydrogenase complex